MSTLNSAWLGVTAQQRLGIRCLHLKEPRENPHKNNKYKTLKWQIKCDPSAYLLVATNPVA